MAESWQELQDVSPDYGRLTRLDGRSFVVLGGGDGIGRETSVALSQVGANVAVVDRDLIRAETVAAEIGGLALIADVVDRASLGEAIASAEKHFGGLDGVIDIVGAAVISPIDVIDDEQWNRQFDLVLRHAYLSLQVAIPALARSGGGSFVFVGSTSGVAFTPGQAAYGAAKAALHHLVHASGRELAPRGIRVNAIAPGYTRTPRLVSAFGEQTWCRIDSAIPRGRAAVPSEIAAPIVFLASDAASYITGQVLLVDGGITGSVPDLLN